MLVQSERPKQNAYVSVQPLTKTDRFVSELKVIPRNKTNQGNAKALCWSHIKFMYTKDVDDDATENEKASKVVDKTQYFCKPCLVEKQKKD